MSSTAARPTLLVIDDEKQIRRLLRVTLESEGYKVRETETGQLGLQEVAHQAPDGIILDLGLPDLDGTGVIRRLREWSKVPVLVLSVREGEDDKIGALDAGADDYLTIPFSGRELLARVRAILRRTPGASEPAVVGFGDIEVDLAARVAGEAKQRLDVRVVGLWLQRIPEEEHHVDVALGDHVLGVMIDCRQRFPAEA